MKLTRAIFLCFLITGCSFVDEQKMPRDSIANSVPLPVIPNETTSNQEVEIAEAYARTMQDVLTVEIKYLKKREVESQKKHDENEKEINNLKTKRDFYANLVMDYQKNKFENLKVIEEIQKERLKVEKEKQHIEEEIVRLRNEQTQLKEEIKKLSQENKKLSNNLVFIEKQLQDLSRKVAKIEDIILSNMSDEQKILAIRALLPVSNKFWPKVKITSGNVGIVCFSNITNTLLRNIRIKPLYQSNFEVLEIKEASFYTDDAASLTWEDLNEIRKLDTKTKIFDLLPFRAIIIKYKFDLSQDGESKKVEFEAISPRVEEKTEITFL